MAAVFDAISNFFTWLSNKSSNDKSSEELKSFISQKFDEQSAQNNKLQETLAINNLGTQASIRHAITAIYYEYKDNHSIPEYVKEDLCRLYDVYKKMGGNSYIETIFAEMKSWDSE